MRTFRVLFAAGCTTACALIAKPVLAQSPTFFSDMKSEYSIGAMRGKAQEFVYNVDGSTLSRLDWTFDNVAMFNAHTSVRLLDWLRVGARTSFNLTDGSTMDDYDFNLGFCPPSTPGNTLCASNHQNTKLRRAHLFDLYASAELFKSGGLTINALAGYKRDHFRWQAIGGTANYATLPPGIGISYEQTWSTPYIGIALAATSGNLTVNGRLTGSAWAKGEDQDDHHLRALTFTDTFDKSRMLTAEVGLAYRINSHLSLTADYRYQQWGTGKGPTTVVDRFVGDVTVFPGNAAGGNAVSHMLSLGVKVDLQPQAVAGGLKDEPTARPAVWTGWSLGAMGGLQKQTDRWRTQSLFLPPSDPVFDSVAAEFVDSGQRAGLFLGHTWRSGHLIWGVEADIGTSNVSSWSHGIPGANAAVLLPTSADVTQVGGGYDGSLRLRAGMQMTPSILAYVTGGLAVQQVKASVSCDAVAGTWCIADRYEAMEKVKLGWTAGVGYELAFAGNWFTRGEYRYTAISDVAHTFFAAAPADAVTARIAPSHHRLTFGLGYRF